MATIKVTLDGATVYESEAGLADEARFLAWVASAYADAGATPQEHLDAWWKATMAGTAANVQNWEKTEAAQTAISGVQDMLTPPVWKAGLSVEVDDLYFHNGVIYRVVQAHDTQIGWEPPTVPALFEVV